MQYQTRTAPTPAAIHPAAAHLPGFSLLMSSAWVRVAGALALVGVLWLAVAWALAGAGA
jgi:hypothetical protein